MLRKKVVQVEYVDQRLSCWLRHSTPTSECLGLTWGSDFWFCLLAIVDLGDSNGGSIGGITYNPHERSGLNCQFLASAQTTYGWCGQIRSKPVDRSSIFLCPSYMKVTKKKKSRHFIPNKQYFFLFCLSPFLLSACKYVSIHSLEEMNWFFLVTPYVCWNSCLEVLDSLIWNRPLGRSCWMED